MKPHVLCAIPTKGRYFTTLPLVLSAILNQTVKPDKLIIFDDTENPVDIRKSNIYQNLLISLNDVGIEWAFLFGKKRGQHFSHQASQDMATDLVWRIDDDEIPEPNVLEILLSNMTDDVGAVGGLIVQPKTQFKKCFDNPINDLSDNCQWHFWQGKKEVQHLYSSFLYRKGIADYELSLSKAAHREETIFSHRIYRKGYKLIVDSAAVTRHFRNPEGGIRESLSSDFEHDERIFQEIQREWNGDMLCYLDNGKGDHVVFKSILPEIKAKYKNVVIACCYPELFEGEKVISLEDAKMFVTPDRFSLYKFMSDRNWNKELLYAFRKMYLDI